MPDALARYLKFFVAVRNETDHANPHYPFFHLKAKSLQPLPGREAAAEV